MSNENIDLLFESYFNSFKDQKKPDGTAYADDQCRLYAAYRMGNDGEPLTEEQFLGINKLDKDFPDALKDKTLEELKAFRGGR